MLADLGERDVDLHPQGHPRPARPRGRRPRPRCSLGFLPPAWLAGTAASRWRRSSTTWRSATTSCTASTTGPVTRRSRRPHLRVGHHLPRRPVAPLAQLPAPHLHQRPRQGPRHRLRHPAHGRGRSRWNPLYLGNPIYATLLALLFECGVALHDVEVERIVAGADVAGAEARPTLPRRSCARPAARRSRTTCCGRSLTGPSAPARRWPATSTANVIAQPVDVHDHLLRPLPGRRRRSSPRRRPRTRPAGDWYFRQLLGSANITGGRLFHVLSGQPEPPDRAPPLPRPAGPPLRRDRRRGAGGVRALRPALQRRAAAAGSSARWCARSARLSLPDALIGRRAPDPVAPAERSERIEKRAEPVLSAV